MTNEKFWELYDNGEITVKIWNGTVDGSEKTIEAFEHDGKFYLRIHEYKLIRKGDKKHHRLTKDWHYTKEFDNKNHANAYFKKAAQGLARVK